MKTIGYVLLGIGYILLGLVVVPLMIVALPIGGLCLGLYELGKESANAINEFRESKRSTTTESL